MGKHGCIDLLSLVITLGVYYFLDMGSDLRLAFEFYNEGHYLRCWTIIGISAVAMYSLNAVGCYWENRDYGLTWRSCIFYFLPYGLLYQRIRFLAILLPVVFYKDIEIKGYNIDHLILREDWKAVILALIQIFASNGLNIVWQMHSLLQDSIQVDSIQFWTKSSVAVSILSCSLALTDYHLVRRIVLGVEKYGKYTLLAFCLTHISTICVLAARFISITLILTSWLYYVFIVIIVIHWIVSLIALIKCELNLFHDIEIENSSDESSIRTHIRTVNLSETKSCALWGSWYFTIDLENTWHLGFLIGTIVLNVVGVLTCFILWIIFLEQKSLTVANEIEVNKILDFYNFSLKNIFSSPIGIWITKLQMLELLLLKYEHLLCLHLFLKSMFADSGGKFTNSSVLGPPKQITVLCNVNKYTEKK
uniref:XK-related protein n=1 Tax=Strigamia maritima TaxID=126957 RepID=T1IYY1_STRMM